MPDDDEADDVVKSEKQEPTKLEKSGADKVPIWVTILTVLGAALITGVGTYLSNMSKISFEREKFREEQQRANQLESRTSQLESQPGKAVRLEGRYEWQWAGEGWKGYISVAKTGTAHIEMVRYLNCGGSLHVLPLLEQKGDATTEIIEDSTKMRISLPVQFITYDANCNRTGTNVLTTLRGELDRHVAYAGKIEYKSDSGDPLGDMVLVKDYISGVN